ncbi:hypothetical protein NBEOAGPD_4697 [Methylobacterium gregans]|uniref:Uncharacterized protein n=1 Tax=Methylobacterium gregans TaxID=374424 RepID=A0AA37HVI7_9HYPH|nr:hypothetical protein [Methylobacterium gregans]GJD81448.1 hypothetical protein NBEOAGPD_4697 [Methylobacterium gregans]
MLRICFRVWLGASLAGRDGPRARSEPWPPAQRVATGRTVQVPQYTGRP